MSAASFVQCCYLARFSKPRAERQIYRKIRQFGISRIVELGVGQCELAQRMISVALAGDTPADVQYTGVDLFEARPSEVAGVALKDAYRIVRPTGAGIKLLPGDPFTAMGRYANSLLRTDLLIIHADQDQESMRRAWFYVPRMLHDRSVVLVEEQRSGDQENVYRTLSVADVAVLANPSSSRRRAA